MTKQELLSNAKTEKQKQGVIEFFNSFGSQKEDYGRFPSWYSAWCFLNGTYSDLSTMVCTSDSCENTPFNY